MKTLHSLTALVLSTATHSMLILGIQSTIDSDIPSNNKSPIQVSLSTSYLTLKHVPETNISQPKVKTIKNKQAPTAKATPPQPLSTYAQLTPTNQAHQKPQATNIVQAKKNIAQLQTIQQPHTIKKTELHKEIEKEIAKESKTKNKTINSPSTNKQPSDILSDAHSISEIITRYPSFSRRRGEEGTVKLAIHIDKDGRVTSIDTVQSSGYSRLDKAARAAIEQALFKPATRNSKVIASIKQLSVRFDLRDTL